MPGLPISEESETKAMACGAETNGAKGPPPYWGMEQQYNLDSERDLSHFLKGHIAQRNHDLARAGDREQILSKIVRDQIQDHQHNLRELLRVFDYNGINLDQMGILHDTGAMRSLLIKNLQAVTSAMLAALPMIQRAADPSNWSGSIFHYAPENHGSAMEWFQKGLEVIKNLIPQCFPQNEKPNKNTDE